VASISFAMDDIERFARN